MIKLENAYAIFTFKPDATMFQISGRDLTDANNEPMSYNKTKRSVKRAWAALEAAWNERTTMSMGIEILEANGVRMHYYCFID